MNKTKKEGEEATFLAKLVGEQVLVELNGAAPQCSRPLTSQEDSQ